MKYEHWIMPGTKVKCYSYIRWSSDTQAKGTTLERQLRTAREIAAENELELVELIDKGISAFKGKNRDEGALGAFIDAVKQKKIPPESWLVVENLDRLSREDIIKAQRLFMELLELGITVVTGMDKKVYSNESVTSNPMDLMYSIMLFARAHEESKTKSKRTYGNALALIRKYEAGERGDDGYVFAIKSVGRNMWWTDCTNGTVRPHPLYFAVAKEIVELILKGWGNYRIAGLLNEKYLPPTKNKHNKWSQNLIGNFYKRRALIGEKSISIEDKVYILDDYYPALIDEDTFYQLQHIKKEKQSKSTATTNVPLISGIGILKCGECGGNMYAFTHRKKQLRYICGTGQQNLGCRAWAFSATWIEDTVLRLAANHVFRPAIAEDDFELKQAVLKEKLIDKKVQIEHLVDMVSEGKAPQSIVKRISGYELEVDNIKHEIESSKLKKQVQQQETVEWGDVDARVLDFTQHELRQEIRLKIAKSVKEIFCIQVKARHIFFRIKFINGREIFAHRTPSVLAFDGGAWMKLGDFYGGKVEITDEQRLEVEKRYGLKLNDDSGDDDGQAVLAGLDTELREKAMDASTVSGYDGYEYRGLHEVSVEMGEAYEKGEVSKQLEQDIRRALQITAWADGLKDTAAIIEDQYQVYKHIDASKVVLKATQEIYYVKGAKFRSDYIPAWQRR